MGLCTLGNCKKKNKKIYFLFCFFFFKSMKLLIIFLKEGVILSFKLEKFLNIQ